MRKYVFLLLLVPTVTFSQKVENTKAEAVGDKIIITFDLTQAERGDNFTVSLFASHNNFGSPLTKVSGDVGQNVKEGRGKRIEWESKAELGKYKGPITFEIEVKVLAAFVLKTDITAAKRGKEVQLLWRGGDQNQNVKIELLKGGKVEGTIGTIANNGKYAWSVPAKQALGKDYTLRLLNGKETATSSNFVVQPKFPMWMKIGVPVVIGTAVVLLLPKSNAGGETANKLIGPPNILD